MLRILSESGVLLWAKALIPDNQFAVARTAGKYRAYDKYGANDIKPGLTGWAQINGRDELEIPVKAKLDGEYAEALENDQGLIMDIKCFLGSLGVFKGDESVVEGGTGEMKRQKYESWYSV